MGDKHERSYGEGFAEKQKRTAKARAQWLASLRKGRPGKRS